MEKNICIYTGTPFDESSHEHILQASFGSRWESNTLICQEMQERFGGVIDTAVAAGISQLRSLFGTKNGRGKIPPPIKNVQSADGSKYTLQPGMQPMLGKATYKIENHADGTAQVQFTMSHENQMPELLARFKRENPTLNFDDSKLGPGTPSQTYIQDPLHLQFVFGGINFFRGILKSAFNLLGVNRPDIALDPGFDAVKLLIVEGHGDTDEFVRWMSISDELPIERLGSIDHTLAIWCRNGTVFGLIQMFGDVPFLLKLGEGIGCEDFYYGYAVNPLRDTTPSENREAKVDIGGIPAFADSPVKPDPAIWDAFGKRISRIMRKLQDLGIEVRIKQIVDDVLLPHDGKLITEEMTTELMDRMREFIEYLVMPPLTRQGKPPA